MKLLITGATGFIGSRLAQDRIAQGDQVYTFVRQSTDLSALPAHVYPLELYAAECLIAKDFERESFDGIIHLATHFCGVHCPSDIPKLIDSNILFGAKVLDSAARCGVRWVINTETFTQHYANEEYSPVNLYSATKQAFADIARYYAEATETTIASLSLFDTFGTGDRRKKIVNLLLHAARTGSSIALSPGEQIMDISPVENILDGYNQLIALLQQSDHKSHSGKTYTLPSTERMILRDFVELCAVAFKSHIDARFGACDYRPREVMAPWTKGVILPGWHPRMTLSEALVALSEAP